MALNQTNYLDKEGMIQEIYKDDPWKLLIGCIMLNRTNHRQVRSVIVNFFEKWPDAETAAEADEAEMAQMLKPLGFYNRRAITVKKFSKMYSDMVFWFDNLEWSNDIKDLPGIGKYASDSYEIFVNNNHNIKPTDKELIKYLNGKKNTDIR